MDTQKELYGLNVGYVYFAGIGDAGYKLENKEWDTLTLQNVRVRKLEDSYSAKNEHDVYVLSEGYLKELFNYMPNDDAIPSITFQRSGIDKLVAFFFEGEPAQSK